MSGHLFIVLGDLTLLNCDAWLLPCDAQLIIEPGWRAGLPSPTLPDKPEHWGNDGVRTVRWGGWPADAAQPWLTNVGGRTSTDWHVEGAAQFIQKASESLHNVPSRAKRGRPLLGMPLVGTGKGGARNEKGGIASKLVTRVMAEMKDKNVDVVLVVQGEDGLAACQQARQRQKPWKHYGQLNEARRLAAHAARSHLALFLGAGVSVGAGLPDWAGLIDQLASEAGFDEELRQELSALPASDYAQLIGRELKGEKPFRERIAANVESPRYSLSHALLASLPTREAVTQNYDTLFESAVKGAGQEMTVLPYGRVSDKRWLLKMHGCRTHPKDIVLNREDYLRYQQERGALAGLVQGLLMTRHLMFVGFSLTDHNFITLLDQVRQARQGAVAGDDRCQDDRFGTAIVHKASRAMKKLWETDLDLVCFENGRDIEVFLDCIAAHCTETSRHLMDPNYRSVLSEEELWLEDRLTRMVAEAPAGLKGSRAWAEVEALVKRLGGA